MEKNLLERISAEYVISHPDVDVVAISSFCKFAENWLAESKLVGAGFDADGMSIQLPDGEKLTFFSATSTYSDSPAVAITGTTATTVIGSGLNTVHMPADTSVSISKEE